MAHTKDTKHEHGLGMLLEHLKRARGFDFTAYKSTSLARRLRKRMETLGIESYSDYQDHLEVHPDEFGLLFNAILINVTGFFRDEQAWEYVRDAVVPQILGSKGPDDPVRVWSAGCASGEEAYTLAMIFCEALGKDKFGQRVKIYATDANETALARARQAMYSEREVEGVPPELLKKYFAFTGGSYVFDADVRRSVVFGRHDLINDSPISRIDLLVCRNTLMYFNGETQSRILQRFHFALVDDGFLMLGKAEMLLSSGHLFAPIDLKRRIVRKVPRRTGGDRPWFLSPLAPRRDGQAPDRPPPSKEASRSPLVPPELRDAAITTAPMAFVLVDASGSLVMANQEANALFGLTADDCGRPLTELSLFYRPADLRTHVQRAVATGESVVLEEVDGGRGEEGQNRFYRVTIAPLFDQEHAPMGVSITFNDVTRYRSLEGELRESNQALETAQEELQTTNEELQSTVEELETTNEELQSTNEELETMNEELQSTNEELRTSNEELRQRSDELDHIEGFWRSVVGGLPAGMIVLDHESRVQVWNARAEDLWGLRGEEVRGKHFLNLDIGLPVDELRTLIKEAVSGQKPAQVVLPGTNRRGKTIKVRVDLSPMTMDRLDGNGQAGGRDKGKERPTGCLLLMQELAD